MKKLSAQELNRLSIDEFKNVPKIPLVLVLDNIRSMHNIGAAFRTADAFLLEKIYLCGITAQPPHRDIHKTALGAEQAVMWEHVPNTYTLLQSLKNAGYLIVALEQTDQSIPLQNYQINFDIKYALVFGNEVFGIQEDTLAACDIALEIPQHGTKHSLNVSISMGIAIWEITKRRLKN
jgi:tRNA G18 (ribose-2'-O)-methylase SpoU